jgi:selenobiotic family peptide radical SAM maturase
MLIDQYQTEAIFPLTCRHLGAQQTELFFQQFSEPIELLSIPQELSDQISWRQLPVYISDLAGIEAHQHLALKTNVCLSNPTKLCLNPSLFLLETSWVGLAGLCGDSSDSTIIAPANGLERLLIFQHPVSRKIHVRRASHTDLLALKIVVEELDSRRLAQTENITLAVLENALDQAVGKGMLLRPPSTLRRDSSLFDLSQTIPTAFLRAETFTLQWHITQACDLHCKHCYDRSKRNPVNLADAQIILDQLYDFCHEHHVFGQVSFSGGNPLLHHDFFQLYQGAADRGLMTAILGNPTTPENIDKIKAIQMPEFYQVSLEGLREHNDFIRGEGHFDRVMTFLKDLKTAGIYSMVMLTLTRGNMDQVLALAESLRGKVDLFTFNRLSAVGEGANLLSPAKEEYQTFLHAFIAAQKSNPVLANKDNLINCLRSQQGLPCLGGCAGFGCGAAFNFVSLLPDGGVHACRKFVSPIGNIHNRTLSELYQSAAAESYRIGPEQCKGCRIRHACGGCLAVIDSQGLDRTRDKDPWCFMDGS